MAESSKNNVREATFKKWPFASDLTYEVEDRIVISVKCKYCSEVEYNKFFCEAKRRNLKGQALKSLESYRSNVTYIHHKTLKRHVGEVNSIHNWCKNIIDSSAVATASNTSNSNQQSVSTNENKRVDDLLVSASFEYYKKLFSTVLTMAKEELAFLKLKSLMLMQMRNGLKLGSVDKINEMAYAEMIDVLAEVVMECMQEVIQKSNYLALSADASEAKKKQEKELVYGKVVARGDCGFAPLTLLLKWQSLKDFGGTDGEGTYKAMLNAIELYIDQELLKKMLVCLTTDVAVVNFGRLRGALARMCDHVDWDALRFHCFNHNLEFGIKDAYKYHSAFENIESTLTTLFYLFKSSGKSWRVVGELLGLNVLR